MSVPTAARLGRWVTELRLTPADRITLGRAVLGGVCAVLVVLGYLGHLPGRSWALFLVALPTALLDAVDGAVARRTNTVTERGARWDVAVDSAVLLILSLALVPLAPWILLMGAARYLFLLGGRFRPQWLLPLPFRQSRRLIGGLQALVTVTALAPVVPITVVQWSTGLSVALVAYSFARDIRLQEQRRAS
ncbi:CDP-alcohol phosphatidyltransferase family protein [Tessaracoccus sp. MC1756]|uniref:CDP-alcohol phosphatidyltransferase family protein n=1 Tax=Tessaracoccus sp. MC1756 TaxID=2760311 RepID=UPI00160337E0|nr:CDP-alcohol phosphatidyltransferase family protein [Tessaracoccus sp. MC1756]MBB1510115.1 CDP-alcohol phosphatidyltransferase family protein [Tessaracoccus sp. MC1756]